MYVGDQLQELPGKLSTAQHSTRQSCADTAANAWGKEVLLHSIRQHDKLWRVVATSCILHAQAHVHVCW
jgi:hypothetical protein